MFDFIVVGSGSGGGALAARLSEDATVNVLLLEAGGHKNRDLRVRVPLSWMPMSEDRSFGWGFDTEPEAGAMDRVLHQPRGKMLGGTSSMNGMMYSRGNRKDYDGWAAMGLDGWSYNDVLPYFRKAESNWRGANAYHGGDGPVQVSRNPRDPIAYKAVTETGKALGYEEREDFHGAEQEGFGMADFTTRNGERESTATAYLDPARSRPNLKIETGAYVTGLNFDGLRVTGVTYVQNGSTCKVQAGEVIVSAGAFSSPQLLLLSGLGPAEELKTLGIDVRADLPFVGKNLQDHPLVAAGFTSTEKLSFEKLMRMDRLALASLRWKLFGGGPLGDAPLSGQAYLNLEGARDYPDTQFQISHVSFMSKPWFPGIRKGVGDQFTAAALQLNPYGRGSVTLRSANPADKPKIHLGLLEDPRDLQRAKNMFAFIRKFFSTSPLADIVGGEVFPGPPVEAPEAIEGYLRASVMTGMHPAGTCAMGLDPQTSVVDANLKVHGIKGLRVCDTSIMPTIVAGNTSAPAMMFGEKLADILLGRAALGTFISADLKVAAE